MIINGVSWRIRLVSPAHPMLLTPHNTHALGVCDKITQTIYIDKTLNSYMIKKVISHEIVHAIMFSYKIDLSYEEEELIANFVSEYGDEILRHTKIIYNGIKMK